MVGVATNPPVMAFAATVPFAKGTVKRKKTRANCPRFFNLLHFHAQEALHEALPHDDGSYAH